MINLFIFEQTKLYIMKKITIALCSLFFIPAMAQDHFGGIATSKRVGIINGNMNPSEFANLGSRFEVQIFGVSINASNNKIGISDIMDGENVEDMLFSGNEGVDFTTDAEIALPGFAFKALGWGFAISTGAHVKANVNDVDPELGRALTGGGFDPIADISILNNPDNQRINATTWGEVGLSASRKIWEKGNHRFNGGVTLKLLFPGSYANVGAADFQGTITTDALGNVTLTDATAKVNIAYSGNLAENFEETSNYTSSLFGGLNGMAGDIGFDYQWKSGKSYKLKVGAAIKNMGSMTFKDDDNFSTNYEMEVGPGESVDMNQFEDAEGIEDIEQILLDEGVLTQTSQESEFKVKLPTVLNLYADIKVVSKLNVTLFMQQKLNENSGNDQITAQNMFSITPRVGLGFFEAFLPISFTEIAGTNAGIGFRLSGFYLGSNSAFTALGSGKQADAYFGYRFGFL